MRRPLPILLCAALTVSACGRHPQPPPAGGATPAGVPSGGPAAASAPPTPPVAVDEPTPQRDESASAPPLLIGRGQFRPASAAQDVSGDAFLYRLADRSHLLRIEGLHIEGTAPELDAVLVRVPLPRDTDLEDALPLGALKGATGNMNYAIPKDIDISEQRALALAVHGQKRLLASVPLAPP